ncbi:hypothetical protein BANRA_00842 [Escherichia coli]|nr:hypothetical protein BANRA_00842 [Escherichia coli]
MMRYAKPFRINSGNITLDYLGGSCPFEINTNPERWNTIKPVVVFVEYNLK